MFMEPWRKLKRERDRSILYKPGSMFDSETFLPSFTLTDWVEKELGIQAGKIEKRFQYLLRKYYN